MIRITGETLALMLPLIVSEAQIGGIFFPQSGRGVIVKR